MFSSACFSKSVITMMTKKIPRHKLTLHFMRKWYICLKQAAATLSQRLTLVSTSRMLTSFTTEWVRNGLIQSNVLKLLCKYNYKITINGFSISSSQKLGIPHSVVCHHISTYHVNLSLTRTSWSISYTLIENLLTIITKKCAVLLRFRFKLLLIYAS